MKEQCNEKSKSQNKKLFKTFEKLEHRLDNKKKPIDISNFISFFLDFLSPKLHFHIQNPQ